MSISTDGRVTQWSIRKGFECYGKILHLHLLQDEKLLNWKQQPTTKEDFKRESVGCILLHSKIFLPFGDVIIIVIGCKTFSWHYELYIYLYMSIKIQT